MCLTYSRVEIVVVPRALAFIQPGQVPGAPSGLYEPNSVPRVVVVMDGGGEQEGEGGERFHKLVAQGIEGKLPSGLQSSR